MLFHVDGFKKVLELRKNLTSRQPAAFKSVNINPENYHHINTEIKDYRVKFILQNKHTGALVEYTAIYNLKDLYYLREPWWSVVVVGAEIARYNKSLSIPDQYYMFKHDSDSPPGLAYKSPLFMPKDAMRHVIKIKSITLKQVKHFTIDEIYGEGFDFAWEFEKTLNDINGKYFYNKNPWVVVYNFELKYRYRNEVKPNTIFDNQKI